MARHESEVYQNFQVSFGFDPIGNMGYFYQIRDCSGEQPVLIEDKDSMFHGVTSGILLTVLNKYLGPKDKAQFRELLTRIAMDLPV